LASPQDFATIAIRGGRALDSHASSLLFPLYQTGTFVHDAVGVDRDFSYSRVSNPTVDALEKAIAALEGTKHALCFRSGLAAESALFFTLLRPGDHVVLSEMLYGGTIRLIREILEPFGIKASFVDSSDATNVEAAITPQTRLLFIETPANPVLRLTDIAAVAEITRRYGVLLAVDNTFLTPALQRPLELGADISVLSTTKYIDGHNATVGGSIATNDAALAERLQLIRKTLGSIQAPFEAWLTLQGLRTLPLRLAAHCQNAQTVAEWLEAHPAVARVHYPGLESFPQHELAQRQQSAGGGMISFELDAPYTTAIDVLNSVQLCSRAESLGGVETLITHPASTTHADVPLETRQHLGISEGLIRLSVGLESPVDIIADLNQAFAAAGCCANVEETAHEVR
jgi:cystathionine beta-lyase/cystathionine gamma-synthase